MPADLLILTPRRTRGKNSQSGKSQTPSSACSSTASRSLRLPRLSTFPEIVYNNEQTPKSREVHSLPINPTIHFYLDDIGFVPQKPRASRHILCGRRRPEADDPPVGRPVILHPTASSAMQFSGNDAQKRTNAKTSRSPFPPDKPNKSLLLGRNWLRFAETRRIPLHLVHSVRWPEATRSEASQNPWHRSPLLHGGQKRRTMRKVGQIGNSDSPPKGARNESP